MFDSTKSSLIVFDGLKSVFLWKLVFTDSNDRWYNEKESYDNDETTSTCLRHSFSGPFEVEVELKYRFFERLG